MLNLFQIPDVNILIDVRIFSGHDVIYNMGLWMVSELEKTLVLTPETANWLNSCWYGFYFVCLVWLNNELN